MNAPVQQNTKSSIFIGMDTLADQVHQVFMKKRAMRNYNTL